MLFPKAASSAIDRRTANWLADIGQNVHDKLSNAGLVEPRASSLLTEFMAEYLKDAKTTQGKPAAANTLKKWKQAANVLNEFFGNKSLRDISHDDAAKFRRWLDSKTLGANGKRTHVSVAKMLFNAAKRRKLVDENPFEFEKASLVLNRSRDFYLSRTNAMKIMERAGLTVWPKLIQNLRGSCETDWLDGGNPAHVVARWVGHSVKVQNDNYAQVDDHHFEQFNAQAKLNPVAIQVASETREIAETGKPMKRQEPRKNQCFTGFYGSMRVPSA